MKKLFVPLAAAAVLAVVRGVTALSLAEPQTGFFPAGTAGFYTAALLLLTALSALLAGRDACPDGANALYSSPAGGAVLLVAALGLAAGAGMAFTLRHRMWQPLAAAAAVSAVCLLLLIPGAAGKTLRGGRQSTGLLLLPLTFYAMVALLTAHLAGRNILHVPENTYTLLGCALALAAVYSESRMRAGLSSPLRTRQLMTAAALLLTATALPMALLRLAGDVVTVTQAPELDLVNTALLPMLWHRAAVLAGGASPAAPEADGTTIQKEELA